MASLIELKDLRGGYVDLVTFVRVRGMSAQPRGQEVRELPAVTVTVANPFSAVPWDVGRKLNPDILAAETASLIGGLSDLEQMKSVSHVFGNFANNDRLLGAYGPRTATQIPLVLKRIVQDPETRQAVATIWNSLELVNSDNLDMPCTVALNWQLRNGKLHMHTFMRSNDVWLGAAYDYGQFTRLQIAMAWALGVAVGTYTHTAANLHIYERDVEKSMALSYPESSEIPSDMPTAPVPFMWKTQKTPLEWDQVEERWYNVRRWMEAAVLGKDVPPDAPTEAHWYFERLKPHASGGTMGMLTRYVLAETPYE